MLHKKERMKLDAITHQRNVCHDILVAVLEGRITMSALDVAVVRSAQKSMAPVSPRVLEILEHLAITAFVAGNK